MQLLKTSTHDAAIIVPLVARKLEEERQLWPTAALAAQLSGRCVGGPRGYSVSYDDAFFCLFQPSVQNWTGPWSGTSDTVRYTPTMTSQPPKVHYANLRSITPVHDWTTPQSGSARSMPQYSSTGSPLSQTAVQRIGQLVVPPFNKHKEVLRILQLLVNIGASGSYDPATTHLTIRTILPNDELWPSSSRSVSHAIPYIRWWMRCGWVTLVQRIDNTLHPLRDISQAEATRLARYDTPWLMDW